MSKKTMFCWSCRTFSGFTVEDPIEGFVCNCGHYQASVAQGAAEVCVIATWHDLNEYSRVATVASKGGYNVPKYPPYVDLDDDRPLYEAPPLVALDPME